MNCRAPKALPSADVIRQVFSYSEETGSFTWRGAKGKRPAGRVAGTVNKRTGYCSVRLNGQHYRVHRLVWVYMTGSDPVMHIDHINGVKNDNRWTNLRLATVTQNLANSRARPNRSGLKGVHISNKGFCARITRNGKTHYIGYFKKPEEAHAAYARAASEFFGEFANAGK